MEHQPKGCIEGTLLSLDGVHPHVAVPVQAIRSGELVQTTLSNAAGRYQLANLQPGAYQIRCHTRGGYVYYPTSVSEASLAIPKKQLSNSSITDSCPSVGQAEGQLLQLDAGMTMRGINFFLAPFKKGTWKSYRAVNGLVYDVVLAIHGEEDGGLWFGTDGGVSHYDGVRFSSFTTKEGLLTNRIIKAIHRDPEGAVWFGTAGGVSRYDGEGFVHFTTEDGLVHNWVVATHQDRDGALWFGTRGGLSRYDGQRFINFTTQDGLPDNIINAIHSTPDGVLWLGTQNGLSRYNGQEFVNFTTEDGLPHPWVLAIHHDSEGELWLATHGGISCYDGEKFINFDTEEGLVSPYVEAIHQDLDGVLWFGTRGGVSRYDGRSFVNFTAEDGLAHNEVNAIHQASDGAMWFGTARAGVCCYDEKSFVSFTTRDGLVDDNVLASCRGSDGAMWFGTWRGLSRLDHPLDKSQESPKSRTGFTNFTTEQGLPHNQVNALQSTPDGLIWLAPGNLVEGSGVSVFDGSQFTTFTVENGLAQNIVRAIHRDSDGTLWFGTLGNGVSRYDGERFTNFTTADGLAGNWVQAIHRTSDDMLWFGTTDAGFGDGGVSRFDGNRFVSFTTEEGLASNTVNVVGSTPDGTVWFGTDCGVSRYDGKAFVNFSTEDGLPHNRVVAIHRSGDGSLWFGTAGAGVARYDGVAWISLDTRDGLAGNKVNSIQEDTDGSLWFATEGGVTHYRRNPHPPRVEVVAVTTDQRHTNLDALNPATVGKRITFEYHSSDFKTHPDKLLYRVKLVGYDADWHPPTRATQVDYVHVPMGDYTFFVQAIDRDGNYSQPATVDVTVQADPQLTSLRTTVHQLQQEVGRKYQFTSIVGSSAPIRHLFALMDKAIDSGLTVLITGETGTGKELVAKAIHYNSPRKDGPLLELNCGAMPRELVASTLFGYRRGAFTGAHEDKMGLFETAAGGTVILDEIGEMPEEAQVHLLRVLQEGKVHRLGEFTPRDVDVRVIATTNRDLSQAVSQGRFREDLYFRLNVLHIPLPALRERLDDIPLLAEHILHQISLKMGKELDGFAPGVLEMLQSYRWPGNVRELEHAIHQAAALAEEGNHIHTYHFSPQVTGGESLIQEILSERVGLAAGVERLQRRMIEDALRECGGNRSQAARLLGIHQPNFLRLMKRLNIE